tara:strand:- start:85 stop:636 length:552 start_codon:yes stop_codon:yes gene_type:complete
MKIKRIWNFLWKEDSLESYVISGILILLLGKFVIFPSLGLLLSSSMPVVAVMSESMQHDSNFDQWYQEKSLIYESNKIYYEDFSNFDFKNGFNAGDVMIVKGNNFNDLEIGDVIVFKKSGHQPTIHRIINFNEDYVSTLGDNNSKQLAYEKFIYESDYVGKAIFKVPLLGWPKKALVDLSINF